MEVEIFSDVVFDIEFGKLLLREGDLLTIGTPASMSCSIRQFAAIRAIAIHHPETSRRVSPTPLVDKKTDFGSVRRRLGIEFMDVVRLRDIGPSGSVRMDLPDVPIFVCVGLEQEFIA